MDYLGSSQTKANLQMNATGQVRSVAHQVYSTSPAISCVSCAVFPSYFRRIQKQRDSVFWVTLNLEDKP